MSGFYKYAEAEPDFVAVVDPDGTEHAAGDLLARANRYVHALRALGLEKGDAVAVVLPNGVLPVEVYLAALQAGWYYVPINYRLSPPEIAYIVQDSGREGDRVARALRRGDRRGRRGGRAARRRPASRTAPSPASRDVEAALAAQPDTLPEDRSAGAAMHYTSGTTGKPEGREAPAARRRPRRHGRAVHRLLQPVRHPPPRGPGAPLHLAELPHRGHHVRRQLAQLRATASSSWTSGTPRRRSPRSSATASPTRTWSRRSSTGCCSCPTT